MISFLPILWCDLIAGIGVDGDLNGVGLWLDDLRGLGLTGTVEPLVGWFVVGVLSGSAC